MLEQKNLVYRKNYFGTHPFTLFAILIVATLLAHFSYSAHADNPTWQQFLYNGPAGSRPYFVYTPQNYQVGTAVPLIVMLHGCTQTPVDVATGTGMNQLAEQYNFIVAYPQQISTYNGALCWNWFNPENQFRGSGEPAILAGIVQEIERNTVQWTIDPHRIYVTGFSAGAAMAVILGATYPDIFAAIGAHSGVEYRAVSTLGAGGDVFVQGGPDPIQQGHEAYTAMGRFARVVPTIVVHGTKDVVADPTNGNQVVQQWMETNLLASHGGYDAHFNQPSSTMNDKVPGGHAYTVYKWNDNTGNEVQEYWLVDGMGHAWSGGKPDICSDPQGPSASLAMYLFFKNHRM